MTYQHDILTHAIAILQRTNLSVEEYSRTVELPDGDFAGTSYNPDLHPAQICTLRAIDKGASWVALCKPVQDGGSLASFVPILRRAHALSQTAIIAYPTMDSTKDAWTKKVWPMLERQGGTQPKKGGGSRGGAARVVTLPSGGTLILRAAGGRQESGQASVTADAMLIDEVDDWPDMRVLRLVERRLSRSRDPLIIYVSTVKRDADDGVDRSRIIRLYQQGSQTRLKYPCVHCGSLFTFEWELVDTEDHTITCPHCQLKINDKQRLQMLEHWQEEDKDPDARASGKFSLTWTALESPFPMLIDGRKLPVLQALCLEYEAAKLAIESQADHGQMRQFYRDRLCRPYTGDQVKDEDGNVPHPTTARLHALSNISTYKLIKQERNTDGESQHIAEIPPWVDFLTAGVDVQRGTDRAPGRLYWLIYGQGQGRGAIAAWGTLPIAPKGCYPSINELHAGLNLLQEKFSVLSLKCPLVRTAIDVGDRQADLFSWIKNRREVFAVKGMKSMQPKEGDSPGWLYPRIQPDNSVIYFIPSKDVTRIVHAEITAEQGKPGSLALPCGLERQSTIIRHICGTKEFMPGQWSEKAEHRKYHAEWSRRIDYLDCLVYARAMAYRQQAIKLTRANPRKIKYGRIK